MTLDDLKQYGMVYLGTPYTKFPRGILAASHEACTLTGKLLQAGVKVFSPIAYGHLMATYSGIDPLDLKLWLPLNDAMMKRSDVLLVGRMEAWGESRGLADEITTFMVDAKPIFYIDPDTLEVEQ
jgi:hypothetical protein